MLQTLFEIITSEASYLKSLHLVISHFVESVEFDAIHSPAAIVTKRDFKILFSNIVAVWTVSARLVVLSLSPDRFKCVFCISLIIIAFTQPWVGSCDTEFDIVGQ